MKLKLIAVACLSFASSAASQGDYYYRHTPTFDFPPHISELTPVAVPSDTNARYWTFNLHWATSSDIVVDTRRINSAGQVSYARRLIGCSRSRFSYLRDADNYDAFKTQEDLPVEFGRIIDGSISYWVAKSACEKSGRNLKMYPGR